MHSNSQVISQQDFSTDNSFGFSELNIITAEINQGQKKPGVAKGPSTLLNGQLIQNLSTKFFDIKCYQGTDLAIPLFKSAGTPYYRLFKKTKNKVGPKNQSLILGGDHSLSLASIPAIKWHYPKLKILWIDAHGDINTPKTSPTGNLHGMSVAALLGLFSLHKHNGWGWFQPCLNPQDIVYIGVRDLDWGEKKILQNYGIRNYSTEVVKQRGMKAVIEEACEYLNPLSDCPMHVSFDIDSLDPSYAPATGVPVKNGLTFNEVSEMAHFVKTTQHLVSLEMVEFNPDQVQNPFEVNLTKSCLERVIQNFL